METEVEVVVSPNLVIECTLTLPLAKASKLYLHTLTFRVNGDVISSPRILSSRSEKFTSLPDIANSRDKIFSNSNADTLFYAQFDLIYLFDINTFNGTPAVRIFNITNGNYTYATNIALVDDVVTEI